MARTASVASAAGVGALFLRDIIVCPEHDRRAALPHGAGISLLISPLTAAQPSAPNHLHAGRIDLLAREPVHGIEPLLFDRRLGQPSRLPRGEVEQVDGVGHTGLQA